MADIPASNWSETDASNATAAPDGAPEGMAPSGVNNTIRAMMGAVKRWYDHTIPKVTAGTTTAYTVTYTVAPGAYNDGDTYLVRFNATNGATPTININALGAIPIYTYTAGAWAAVATGVLTANMVCLLSYNTSEGSFRVITSSATAIGAAFLATVNAFTGNNTFAGTSGFSGLVTLAGVAINEAQGSNIASATTTDIGAATGNYVKVTGTTTITGLGTIQAGTCRVVEFTGALTLTHNGTSLILPTAANIVTAAGDCAHFISEGSGNWRCVAYQRADGTALVGTLTTIKAALGADVTLTNAGTYYDGPSIAQGSAGTWYVSASCMGKATGGGFEQFYFKLWDGATVIATGYGQEGNNTLNPVHCTLSGYIASPAGNLRMSVAGTTYASGAIAYNFTGTGKDSTIFAIRVA